MSMDFNSAFVVPPETATPSVEPPSMSRSEIPDLDQYLSALGSIFRNRMNSDISRCLQYGCVGHQFHTLKALREHEFEMSSRQGLTIHEKDKELNDLDMMNCALFALVRALIDHLGVKFDSTGHDNDCLPKLSFLERWLIRQEAQQIQGHDTSTIDLILESARRISHSPTMFYRNYEMTNDLFNRLQGKLTTATIQTQTTSVSSSVLSTTESAFDIELTKNLSPLERDPQEYGAGRPGQIWPENQKESLFSTTPFQQAGLDGFTSSLSADSISQSNETSFTRSRRRAVTDIYSTLNLSVPPIEVPAQAVNSTHATHQTLNDARKPNDIAPSTSTPEEGSGSHVSDDEYIPARSLRKKKEKKHQCQQCSKVFSRSTILREHLRSHDNERPFECNDCGKGFARLKDRKRHEALHIGEKKFICKGRLHTSDTQQVIFWGCGGKFSREDGLKAHFLTEVGWKCTLPLLKVSWEGGWKFNFSRNNSQGSNTEQFVCSGQRYNGSYTGCHEGFGSGEGLFAHFRSPDGMKCIRPILVDTALDDCRELRVGICSHYRAT